MPLPVPAPDAAPPIDDALWEERLVPLVERLIRARYFSFEVEGLEHVPQDGRAVYAQNHAGWFPLDAFFVGLAVRRAIGPCRTPYFATAEAALALPVVGSFIRRVGAVPSAWFRRPERLPPGIHAAGFFPEGVPGNTKPFWEAYRMRPWSRGFVRVAAALDLPIIPAAVLGGEECLPVAWTVKLLEPFVGSSVRPAALARPAPCALARRVPPAGAGRGPPPRPRGRRALRGDLRGDPQHRAGDARSPCAWARPRSRRVVGRQRVHGGARRTRARREPVKRSPSLRPSRHPRSRWRRRTPDGRAPRGRPLAGITGAASGA